MKFIKPKTTDSPTESRKSSIAYCSPLRSWMTSDAGSGSIGKSDPLYRPSRLAREGTHVICRPSLELAAVRRVLDVLDAAEDVEVDLVADLLGLVDIDVLNDIVGLRVDLERAARAFHADLVQRLDQRRLVGGLAAIALQRGVDQLAGVVALRGEFRGGPVVLGLELRLEGLVDRVVDRRDVVEDADPPRGRIALAGQVERRDQPAGSGQLDRFLQAELAELLDQRGRRRAGEEGEDGVRLLLLDLGQIGAEIADRAEGRVLVADGCASGGEE